MDGKTTVYRPIPFILLTFCTTWVCAFFMAYQTWFDAETFTGAVILDAFDFLENAAPLLAAMLLLRGSLCKGRTLARFIFGRRPKISSYTAVALLFILQFLTLYLTRTQPGDRISAAGFLSAWTGQILFGGGLEEGGWRGYLQPAFEKKMNALLGVVGVSLVWTFWHLPYFFLPNSDQSGSSFLFYAAVAAATAFTLTAIHKMTGSVLLCTLFHGWQNAIVMNIAADMGRPLFLVLFGLQTAVSVVLCVRPLGARRDSQRRADIAL